MKRIITEHRLRIVWAAIPAVLLIIVVSGSRLKAEPTFAEASQLMCLVDQDVLSQPVAGAAFVETFDGDPAAPAPWEPAGWEVTVHRRAWAADNYKLNGMNAQHGPDCSAPPATHYTDTFEGAVFNCRNHVMTAINEPGYGAIYLTPNQLVDFSQGEAVIRFDVSTARNSTRDWIDLWITPYQENLQLPLTDWLPDLSGEPKRALHFDLGVFFSGGQHSHWRAQVINNHSVTQEYLGTQWIGWEDLFTPDAMIRTTHEIRISKTRISICVPAYFHCWVDQSIPTLSWDKGVVQLGHHSYTPFKDGNGGPTTWHWDNVSINPSVPFTIIHADRRYTDSANPAVNLAQPAPAGANLRFAGQGQNLKVRFNGGAWQNATKQAQERYSSDGGTFESYWTPIPQGTTRVEFSGDGWWAGPWHVRDISVWSLSAAAGPTPTPTPTQPPTATPTDSPPPPTASATPTGSPTPTLPPSTDITIDALSPGAPISPLVLGSNVPAWLNPGRLAYSRFRTRSTAAGLSIVRMPGGSWSNSYDWLACERRGQGIDANAVCYWPWAARPSDFIQYLRATGLKGMYTINMNGTSKEAAALVAFFNGDVADERVIGVDVRGRDWGKVGDWARLRAANGSPEPLRVEYWEIGNEIYGGRAGGGKDCLPWGWEPTWTCDGTEYVNGVGSGSSRREGFLEFRNAMRAVDPAILVGAVGVPIQNDWSNWGNEVIAAAGQAMDFYVVHQYGYFDPPASHAEALAQPQQTWMQIMTGVRAAFDQYAGGRRVPVAITEHNLFSVQERDTADWMSRAVNGLYLADNIGQMMLSGVAVANQWDIAHGEGSSNPGYGMWQADTYFAGPQYFAFPLWSRFGNVMLPVNSRFNAADTLSVYGGRVTDSVGDGDTITLLAINKTGSPIAAGIQINGATVSGGTLDVMQANTLDDLVVSFNGVINPADDLSNAPSLPLSVSGSLIGHTFPPYSVSLLRLETGAPPATPTATPSPTPSPTATPSPTPSPSPTPTAGPRPAYGIINSVGTAAWTPVTLPNNYTSMVVVAGANYDRTLPPLAVRIRNASGNRFEMRLQRMDNSTQALSGVKVHYLVVEAGVYNQAQHGVKMEAVRFQSDVTNGRGAWIAHRRSYLNSYTTPVVVGQVMSSNDARPSVFFAYGPSLWLAPSNTGLNVGKHVGEDPNRTRAVETVGYIVMEAGSWTIGSRQVVAGVTSDIITGFDNSPPTSFGVPGLTSMSAVVVSANGIDGTDGGWPVLYGATPLAAEKLYLAIDEDRFKDSERSHTSEQAAYIVIR